MVEWSLSSTHTAILGDIIYVKLIYRVSQGERYILGGHSIGHSKPKIVYVHVSYSELFLR
jgi:hypothetical protein